MKKKDFHFSLTGRFKISINNSEFLCSNFIHSSIDDKGKTDYFEFHHLEDNKVYLIRYVQIAEEDGEAFLIYNDKKLKIVSYDKNKIYLSDGVNECYIKKIKHSNIVTSNIL